MKQGQWMDNKITQKDQQSDLNLVDGDSFSSSEKQKDLEELLNLLMVNTDECLLVVDINLHIVTFNLKFSEQYAVYFGKEIIRGEPVLSFVQSERYEIAKQIYESVLKGEKHESVIDVSAPDGTISSFLNKFKPVYDKNNDIIGVFISSYDITESKKIEMALRISEERYHYIIENALEGFLLSEKSGVILDVNKTSCKMFGYTLEEFKKLTWRDIIVYEDEQINKFREDRDLTNRARGELTAIHKSGRHFPCEFSSIFYNDGTSERKISTFISDISERRQIEEKARIREKRFASLVEHGADGIAVLKPDGTPVYLSPGIEKVLGYTVEEAMGMDLFSATHPDDKHKMQSDWETVMERPAMPVNVRLARIKHKDGTWRWVEGILVNMLHEPGIGGIVNNFRDVTSKVLAEQEKEFERRDKEALINSSENLIWSVSNNFKLIAGNNAFIESIRMLTGFILVPGDDLLMRGYFDQRYLEFWQSIYSKGLKGASFREEIFITGLPGIPDSWIELSINPIYDHGDIIGIACFSRNISEQKQLQESLTESEEKFRAAFKFSAIGMAIVGLDGSYKAVNDSLCQITGYSIQELKELTYHDITHPDDIGLEFEVMKELMNGRQETYQLEKRYLHKSKDIVWIYLASSLVRDKNGEPMHFVSQIEDITQRKRDELHLRGLNESLNQRAEQLAASNAELEQFAYIASHDLQEPLRMITSFLTQLEKKYKDKLDDKANQYINFAVDGATRMRAIILDLLEYSKVGRKAYELDWIDMNSLVKDVVEKNIWKTKGAQIEWKNLPTIYGARIPLFQVMQNLISNAIKYKKKEEKPRIVVSALEELNYWHFSVADNGIGIEPQYFDKIFVLFQRLHHKEEYSGSGIGLAICKKIIENHNGKIWVESEYGQGSTFHFIINK